MDISTIEFFFQRAKEDFASKGLQFLASQASSLLEELENHKPDGPHFTRLLDNIYGLVWESFLNAALVDNMPPKVLESIQIMENELAEVIRQIPDELGSLVVERFTIKLRDQLPPHWAKLDNRLKTFMNLECPGQLDMLHLFITGSSTGQEVVGAFLIAGRLIISLQDLDPNYFSWTASTCGWYKRDIVPMKGKSKFTQESNNHCFGSGITLAHHPRVDDTPPHFRTVTNRVWDLDIGGQNDTSSPNLLALRRGLGYGSGISGHMFTFARLFLDIAVRRKDFQIPHAILGLLIFMVYTGGHTWNEGLQTVNYLEHTISVGILPEQSDPSTYVSDYGQFISIFDMDTQSYL